MELYRHGYTLMDKHLMELVDWNEGKTAVGSEQAASAVIEGEFDEEENVLLASG